MNQHIRFEQLNLSAIVRQHKPHHVFRLHQIQASTWIGISAYIVQYLQAITLLQCSVLGLTMVATEWCSHRSPLKQLECGSLHQSSCVHSTVKSMYKYNNNNVTTSFADNNQLNVYSNVRLFLEHCVLTVHDGVPL